MASIFFVKVLICVALIIQFANDINSALAVHFPTDDVRIIAEPGRYYSESAFTLATRVHSMKRHAANNTMMYYIGDSIFGSFNNMLGNSYHPTALKVGDAKLFE